LGDRDVKTRLLDLLGHGLCHAPAPPAEVGLGAPYASLVAALSPVVVLKLLRDFTAFPVAVLRALVGRVDEGLGADTAGLGTGALDTPYPKRSTPSHV